VFIAGRRQTELDNAAAEIGENVTAIEADESSGRRTESLTKNHLSSMTRSDALNARRKSRRWRCSLPQMKAVSSPEWTYTSMAGWLCHEHRRYSRLTTGRYSCQRNTTLPGGRKCQHRTFPS
jgi:hypothetical protein